jgi:hypothetical protein
VRRFEQYDPDDPSANRDGYLARATALNESVGQQLFGPVTSWSYQGAHCNVSVEDRSNGSNTDLVIHYGFLPLGDSAPNDSDRERKGGGTAEAREVALSPRCANGRVSGWVARFIDAGDGLAENQRVLAVHSDGIERSVDFTSKPDQRICSKPSSIADGLNFP